MTRTAKALCAALDVSDLEEAQSALFGRVVYYVVNTKGRLAIRQARQREGHAKIKPGGDEKIVRRYFSLSKALAYLRRG